MKAAPMGGGGGGGGERRWNGAANVKLENGGRPVKQILVG